MGMTICRAPRCRDRRGAGQTGPRPAISGTQLCSVCRANLADDLAELPDLHSASEYVLDTRRPSMKERVSGGEYTGIALNATAVESRSDTLGVLASWSGLLADERQVSPPRHREVNALAPFLLLHLDWLAAHPAVADFVAEISSVTRAARAVAYPNRQVNTEVGPCIVPGCEHTIHATIRPDDERQPSRVSCADGHTVPPQQWLLLGRRIAQGKLRELEEPSRDAEGAA